MERISQRELAMATRVADALVYTAGVAGVVAGGLLLRGGSIGFALVAWVLTFVAGASLRLLSAVARAVSDIKRELDRPGDPEPPADPDAPSDPYRRWGGWH